MNFQNIAKELIETLKGGNPNGNSMSDFIHFLYMKPTHYTVFSYLKDGKANLHIELLKQGNSTYALLNSSLGVDDVLAFLNSDAVTVQIETMPNVVIKNYIQSHLGSKFFSFEIDTGENIIYRLTKPLLASNSHQYSNSHILIELEDEIKNRIDSEIEKLQKLALVLR